MLARPRGDEARKRGGATCEGEGVTFLLLGKLRRDLRSGDNKREGKTLSDEASEQAEKKKRPADPKHEPRPLTENVGQNTLQPEVPSRKKNVRKNSSGGLSSNRTFLS